MNALFYKITSTILAILVMLSTVLITVEKHYCGEFLIDVSFFNKAADCATVSNNCNEPITKIKKKKCCKDEIEHIQGQDKLQKKSASKITFKQVQFLLSFVCTYHNIFNVLQKQLVPFRNYIPPDLTTNIQVLYEVYII